MDNLATYIPDANRTDNLGTYIPDVDKIDNSGIHTLDVNKVNDSGICTLDADKNRRADNPSISRQLDRHKGAENPNTPNIDKGDN